MNIEQMTAKELYNETKYCLYPTLAENDKHQVIATKAVYITVRGIDFNIKATKDKMPLVGLYHTKHDELDLTIDNDFKTVPNLIKAIDKELLKFAKGIIDYTE